MQRNVKVVMMGMYGNLVGTQSYETAVSHFSGAEPKSEKFLGNMEFYFVDSPRGAVSHKATLRRRLTARVATLYRQLRSASHIA